jgi:hypothetical protein
MENYFINPFTLSALVPLIVEFLKNNLGLKDKVLFKIFKRKIYLAQVVSIGVSIALTTTGMLLKLGFLSDTSLILTLSWGILIGFSASGMFMAGYLDVLYSFFHSPKSNTL